MTYRPMLEGRQRLAWTALAVAVTLIIPSAVQAEPRLLDDRLRLAILEVVPVAIDDTAYESEESSAAPTSVILLAAASEPAPSPPSTGPGSLDFDLLGAAKPPPPIDEKALHLRRTMLTAHQGLGFGLFALQLATTVVGQLNYSDRFGNGPSTGKYEQTHAVLAFATLGAFGTNALLALLAPKAAHKNEGFDRVTLHKIAMGTAAAGMIAEGVLGVYTAQREGYLNQPSVAKAHLAIGYLTMAAVTVGVGALVF